MWLNIWHMSNIFLWIPKGLCGCHELLFGAFIKKKKKKQERKIESDLWINKKIECPLSCKKQDHKSCIYRTYILGDFFRKYRNQNIWYKRRKNQQVESCLEAFFHAVSSAPSGLLQSFCQKLCSALHLQLRILAPFCASIWFSRNITLFNWISAPFTQLS